jgi:chorismate synthase
VLSGLEPGTDLTLGTPIAMLVGNSDARSHHYDDLAELYRPSHADYTYDAKYGLRAVAGGGRASARETVGRVAAGALAEDLLAALHGVEIVAWVAEVADVVAPLPDLATLTRDHVDASPVRCPDPASAEAMIAAIDDARRSGDTVGGVIRCVARKVPPGWGAPIFDKLTAALAQAMMSLPASRGFEVGDGFASTRLRGSQHNDPFAIDPDAGQITTTSNHSGGIQGGISNGQTIRLAVAFKPVATIFQPQHTVTRDRQPDVSSSRAGATTPACSPAPSPWSRPWPPWSCATTCCAPASRACRTSDHERATQPPRRQGRPRRAHTRQSRPRPARRRRQLRRRAHPRGRRRRRPPGPEGPHRRSRRTCRQGHVRRGRSPPRPRRPALARHRPARARPAPARRRGPGLVGRQGRDRPAPGRDRRRRLRAVLLGITVIAPDFWAQPWDDLWPPVAALLSPALLMLLRERMGIRSLLVTDTAIVEVTRDGTVSRLVFSAIRTVRRDLLTGGVLLQGKDTKIRVPPALVENARLAIVSQRRSVLRGEATQPDDPLRWLPGP